jgi:hypothetical protein
MLEKLARAIYALSPLQDQPVDADMRPLGPWFDMPWERAIEDDGIYTHYLEAAKAALQSLLQPDEGTVEAVCRELDFGDKALARGNFWIGWTTAINHILKGEG